MMNPDYPISALFPLSRSRERAGVRAFGVERSKTRKPERIAPASLTRRFRGDLSLPQAGEVKN
jgi:hypothetical protein